MQIARHLAPTVAARLDNRPSVLLLGSRQVGKTTLARYLATQRQGIYLDLESPEDRGKIANIEQFCRLAPDQLVVFDEIQKVPDLFAPLRSIIDGRSDPKYPSRRRAGQFLMLGSASLELQRQVSETLAGRISYLELAPFHLGEIGAKALWQLWLRGGYPDSFLAESDAASMRWRRDLTRSYLERDIPAYGVRASEDKMRNLWTMLAHCQCQTLNVASLARALGTTEVTVRTHISLFVNMLLVRQIPPWRAHAGKRIVKRPKTYIRDSGLCHQLLGIASLEQLFGHPISGASWEGFVVEHIVQALPDDARYGYYRTQSGAEIDLVVEFADSSLWCVEIKRSTTPQVARGFHTACNALRPARRLLVHGREGADRFPLAHGVEAVGLVDVLADLGVQMRL